MRKVSIGVAGALLASATMGLASLSPAFAGEEASQGGRCEGLTGQTLPGRVKINKAGHVAAAAPGTVQGPMGQMMPYGLPSHCLVEGVINERQGAGDTTYGIGFELALPDDWNGRFLLMGGGGLNGTINPPIGPVASGSTPALARGFAVLSHDSGHKGAVFDDSFMVDQRASLDFAESSVRTVTLMGQDLTATYYGKAAHHSYMTGCSTGGREGMLASQRYPELFDGIVVGAPAMRTGDSNLGTTYASVMFNRAAPRDERGLPVVTEIFTPSDRTTLLNGLLAQCDGLDGLEDGLINNVAQCKFEPARLQCTAGQTEDCLDAAQVEALDAAFAGPFDSAGYPIYAPVPFDTGIVATEGPIPGYLPTGTSIFGPPTQALEIDLDAQAHMLRQNAVQRLTDTNYWTNLNTYLDKGSKILFYHGVSDPWFSAWATWDYYERAGETNGAAWYDASRFYMVPGMGHCGGGNALDNFDLLGPLVEWTEKGEAPDSIVATRANGKPGAQPLCNYPAYPRYTGGDVNSASSYACTDPSS